MKPINTNEHNQMDYHSRLFAMDEENNKCVDCYNEPVTYLSINNGVTLCKDCANKHSVFSSSISYLRKIEEELDEYLFNFFVYGGNTKFITCLQLFSIENSIEIEKKYNTYGVDYYRRNLKAKVKGLKPIDNINFSKGAQIKETTEDDYPEFHGYKIQLPKVTENANGMNKFRGFLSKLTAKVSDLNIKEKLNEGKAKTMEGIAKVGLFVSSATAPTKNKIKNGASYLSSSFQNMFNGVKDKFAKINKENTNKGIPTVQNNEQSPNTSSNENNNSQYDSNIKLNEYNNMPSSVI